MENNKLLYKTGINSNNQILKNQININTINADRQPTEPNSSKIQDIVEKQQKLYDDIIALSSNINLNYDLNEKNNINDNINNNEELLYHISGTSHPSHNIINDNQLYQNNPNSKNINLIKGEQSKKLNELINRFNNLYSSENNNGNYENYNHINNKRNEERESNNLHYNTINHNLNNEINGNINNNYNNNISSDDIFNKKKTNISLINRNQNRSNENISNQSENINEQKYEKIFLNNRDRDNNNKQNKIYQNKTRLINRINNFYSHIRPKHNSMNHISKSFRNKSERKLVNKYYDGVNIDNNNPDISSISIKANQVINEFKKHY